MPLECLWPLILLITVTVMLIIWSWWRLWMLLTEFWCFQHFEMLVPDPDVERRSMFVTPTAKHVINILTLIGTAKDIPLFRYRLRSHDCNRVINFCKWKFRPECSPLMRNIFLSVNDVGVIIKTNFGKHHWIVFSYGS